MALSAGISALLDAAIRAGLRSGFSGRRILQAFRDQGGRIRNETFFRSVGEIRIDLGDEFRFRRLTDDRVLTDRILKPVTQRGQSPFAAIFEVTFENEATGNIENKIITLNFNTPESVGELKRRAIELEDQNITESDQRDPFQGPVINIVLVNGLKRLEPASFA